MYTVLRKGCHARHPQVFSFPGKKGSTTMFFCLSSLPVSQILLQCGYQTEIHFFRQFKAITGMTPGEYRRSCR